MTTMQPPRTGVERRFEDELHAVPGWHAWDEQARPMSRENAPRPPRDDAAERRMESQMILGR